VALVVIVELITFVIAVIFIEDNSYAEQLQALAAEPAS
jgi:hypothetical protein